MGRFIAMLAVVSLGLAGCGNTTEDRAVSGAGIGAAAGAVLGAVTGMSVLQGALIGTAAGGLTGAMTTPDQVNLGTPAWKRSSASNADVKSIQSGLATLGYGPGPADGVIGSRTRAAIHQYQADNKLLVDGKATVALARHIEETLGKRPQYSGRQK
ncbi:MAG: peptidoglycan-binding domain-containing protein [Alphaproteobacteria bacterium]